MTQKRSPADARLVHPLSSQVLEIAARRITLQLPTDPEQLLEDAVQAGDESDPYWGILWDAAIVTAECVLQTEWTPGLRALELGCGAGLVGIAGLLAGLEITFSDLVPEAVELSLSNAACNGFPDSAGQIIDWRDPVNASYDVLLASDVLYDSKLHKTLLEFAQRALRPEGHFWIGDPGRLQALGFLNCANDMGWTVEIHDGNLRPVSVPTRSQFQLLTLHRPPVA